MKKWRWKMHNQYFASFHIWPTYFTNLKYAKKYEKREKYWAFWKGKRSKTGLSLTHEISTVCLIMIYQVFFIYKKCLLKINYWFTLNSLFHIFSCDGIRIVLFFVKECYIEAESTIQHILYSSRSIKSQIFRTSATTLINELYDRV